MPGTRSTTSSSVSGRSLRSSASRGSVNTNNGTNASGSGAAVVVPPSPSVSGSVVSSRIALSATPRTPRQGPRGTLGK